MPPRGRRRRRIRVPLPSLPPPLPPTTMMRRRGACPWRVVRITDGPAAADDAGLEPSVAHPAFPGPAWGRGRCGGGLGGGGGDGGRCAAPRSSLRAPAAGGGGRIGRPRRPVGGRFEGDGGARAGRWRRRRGQAVVPRGAPHAPSTQAAPVLPGCRHAVIRDGGRLRTRLVVARAHSGWPSPRPSRRRCCPLTPPARMCLRDGPRVLAVRTAVAAAAGALTAGAAVVSAATYATGGRRKGGHLGAWPRRRRRRRPRGDAQTMGWDTAAPLWRHHRQWRERRWRRRRHDEWRPPRCSASGAQRDRASPPLN